ncbi:MAG: AMP-binding protein [Corynebacterium sp.]|uniref:alpha/beta fold hydrolase n=1 Tax=Corynebacterium sp. TaxID=1720 RepID=UPI0026DB94DA|nr:alpha/beta fold hydrolase [Corynebacterium sp.]MDO4761660.1 AMP-binding protein [Corynebacterium sp.]
MTTPRKKYRLHPGQRSMWLAHQLNPNSSAYHCAELIEFEPQTPIDLDLLENTIRRCLEEVTVFHLDYNDAETATYYPNHSKELLIHRHHLPSASGENRRETIMEWAEHTIGAAHYPQLRGRALTEHHLITTGDGQHFWLARFHHITGDGFAFNSLITWIANCYTAEHTGRHHPDTTLIWDYFNTRTATTTNTEHETWWAHNPPAPAPASILTTPAADETPVQARIRLSKQQRAGLRGHTEFGIIVAAVARYIAGITAAEIGEHITLGLPLMNRPLGAKTTELAPLVSVAPLAIPVGAGPETVADIMGTVRQYTSVGVEKLREILGLTNPTTPLTGPHINFRPFNPTFRFGDTQAVLHTISVGPIHDVEFIFQSQPTGELDIILLARGSNHREEITHHAERIAHILTQIAAPGQKQFPPRPQGLGEKTHPMWEEVDIILDAEHQQFNTLNSTKQPLAHTSLQELIHATQATTAADQPAVKWRGRWYTHAELDAHTTTFRTLIAPYTIGPGTIVAVEIPRSLSFIAAIKAIAETGAAFCPIDPYLPESRRDYMREASQATILITADHNDTDVDTQWEVTPLATGRHTDPTTAYVLFTSGSTGKPKATAVPTAGIVNRLEWMCHYYQITPKDTLIHKTPSSFDVSVWEYLLIHTHAIPTVIAEAGAHKDPDTLLSLLEDVTIAHFVPSALKTFFIAHPNPHLPTLRAIITSGEALDIELAQRTRRALGVEVHNLYGPTEAAIDVTAHTITDTDTEVPIGHPVWNTQIEILDTFGKRTPTRHPGTLYIGGIQVGLGYLGQEELTRQRFQHGYYNTGDIAYWDHGEIHYIGRKDGQIKLRGQRLELGEIETCLATYPGIGQVAVAVKERAGHPMIVAYRVGGDELDEQEILGFLRSQLPEYMVPSAVMVLESLPVTINGKLDASALPTPEFGADQKRSDALLLTETQQQVMAAFSAVIGVEVVDAQANFFSLGGNSLLVVQLRQHLADAGYHCTVGDIFAHPTPSGLAEIIENNAQQLPIADSALRAEFGAGFAECVTFAAPRADADCGPDIFCLYPAGGLSWAYTSLLPHVESGRGVFGIQAPGLNDFSARAASIADAARSAVEQIIQVCSRDDAGQRSVDVIGWSVGGVVAQEVACQLVERGITVRTVVLLDAYPAEVWKDLPAPTDEQLWQGIAAMAGLKDVVAEDEVLAALRSSPGVFSALTDEQLLRIQQMIKHNAALMRSHCTRSLDLEVWHFLAQADVADRDRRITPAAWVPNVRTLRTRSFDVSHPGMVSSAVLKEVADIIRYP